MAGASRRRSGLPWSTIIRSVQSGRRRRIRFASVAAALAGILAVGSLVSLSGPDSTLAAGGAAAPATWTSDSAAVSGSLASTSLTGAADALEYAFGLDYAGATTGEGAAISGSGLPSGVVQILQGDTLTGSAAAWSAGGAGDTATATPAAASPAPSSPEAPAVAVQGVDGTSATLGGQLAVTARAADVPGLSQVRWQIADADPAKVNAGDSAPATLAALTDTQGGAGSGSSASSASLRVFVAHPELTADVEVCATGTDCDPAAGSGTGGWSAEAVLPAGVSTALVRVTALNTGNVAMADVKVASVGADTADAEAGVGKSIGDLSAGQSASTTFPVGVTAAAQLTATVSGTFSGDGPDGKPLASRFTDAAGAVGRVPSAQASAHVSPAPEQGPASTPTATPASTPTATSTPGAPSVTPPSGTGIAPAAGAMPIAPTAETLSTIDITAALNSAASQPSGSTWQYLISLSCSPLADSGCPGMQLTIPIPDSAAAQTGISGAWTAWNAPTVTADSTLLGGVASRLVTVSGGNWVLALSRALSSGESTVLTLNVVAPNYSTPDGFTWTLQPTVSAPGAASVTANATVAATATASGYCNARYTGSIPAGPVGSTRSLSSIAYFGFDGTASRGQLAPAPGTAVTRTVSYPAALSYVADGTLSSTPSGSVGAVVSASDPDARVLTYSAPITAPLNTYAMVSINADFYLNGPAGSYPIAFGASYLPLGATTPMTCTGSANVLINPNTITGALWTKRANGVSPSATNGNLIAGTSGLTGTNYVSAWREDRTTTLSYWDLTVNRNNATLQDVHIFDGMPCLTSGSGTSTSDPYLSLAEKDAPCTQPAFHLWVLRASNGGVLDQQRVTFEYTDGTSAVISATTSGSIPNGSTTMGCSVSAPCYQPDPSKMVASVVLDGSYSVDDAASTKDFLLYGAPVATLSTDRSWYLRNAGTGSAVQFPAESTVSVGMVTPLDGVLLGGYGISSQYTYTATWSGTVTNNPCNGAPGASCIVAYASDPALASQRRVAVVVPDGSGTNVTQVRPYYSGAVMNSPVSPVQGNYGDFGPASNLYLINAAQLPGDITVPPMAGVGVNVSYGGMQPGVYVYYVYTGLTDTDPTDGGDSCTQYGGTIVTDTTGIIGEPGVARKLCRSTDTITVKSPAAGINVSKVVRDVTAGTGWVTAPNAVVTAPGDTVEFRIRVSNTGPDVLTNVAVYDILPHSGDMGISAALLQQPRGSTGTPPLASLPSVPDPWKVAYSTSTNPCRPEVGVPLGTAGCTDTWTSAADVADVRAVRLTIATVPVATATTPYYDFVLTYTVPTADAWTGNDVEWNSVAAGGTYGTLTLAPAEPSKVGFAAQLTFVHKVGKSSDGSVIGQPGSAWQVLSDDHGSAGSPVEGAMIAPVTGQTGLFAITGLGEGTWWLRETQAPPGFELMATPIQFAIGDTGVVTLGNQASGYAAGTVSSGTGVVGADQTTGKWVITINDVPHRMLPALGSTAADISRSIGGALLAVAAIAGLVLGIRSRRRSRASRLG